MNSYILLVWTAIIISQGTIKYDWRPIGEFHGKSRAEAQALCESAARELDLPPIIHSCVRSR